MATPKRKPARAIQLAEDQPALAPALHRSYQQRRQERNEQWAQNKYLEAIPKVYTATAAAKLAGVTLQYVHQWRNLDPVFREREDEARDQLADSLESEAVRRAVKGVKKPIYQQGILAGYETVYSDALLALLLKAAKPDKYRERSEVTLKPIVKVVSGFDPEEAL